MKKKELNWPDHTGAGKEKGGSGAGRKVIVLVVVLLLLVMAGFLVYREHVYAEAERNLSRSSYELAARSFDSLGNYKDSRQMYQTTLCSWAKDLAKENAFDQALDLLDRIPGDQEMLQLKQEVQIRWGRTLLAENRYDEVLAKLELVSGTDAQEVKNEATYQLAMLEWEEEKYSAAYKKWKSLGQYRDSEEKLSEMILQWVDLIIESGKLTEAVRLETLGYDLTEAEAQLIYDRIAGLEWTVEDSLVVPVKLLEMVQNMVPEARALCELLSEYDYAADFIYENRDEIRMLWDVPIVQSMVKDDFLITHWLMGKWKIRDGKFIEFYQSKKDPNVIISKFSLPRVKPPAGTKYFNIKNMEFVFTNAEDEVLAPVYAFEMLGPDEMDVYCYQNQKTYSTQREP